MNTGDHNGGRDSICPVCSGFPVGNKPCVYYNKDGTLTRYAFSCGYVETHAQKNLHMRHGVFHVAGQDINGNFVNKSFDTVKPARAFLRARGEKDMSFCHNHTSHDRDCDCATTGIATVNGKKSSYRMV